MPVLDYNNNRLGENDYKALESMIKGSLQNHKEVLLDLGDEWRGKGWRQNDPRSLNWKAYFDKLSEVCDSVIEALPAKMQSYMDGDENLTPEQVIDRVFSDFSHEIIRNWYANDPRYADAHKRFVDVATSPENWDDPVISEEVGLRPNNRVQSSEAIYNYSTGRFAFSTKPMRQIYEIGDYDAEHDSVKSLSKARSGGSTTLNISAKQLEDKLNRIKNSNPNDYKKNPEYRQTNKALKAHKALEAGEDLSRKCSVRLQRKDHVSFSDLYNTLMLLHKQVDPSSDRSGKLRGTGVSFGREQGVSTTAAPIIVYKTLQQVADRMNEVKQETNRALQKTKAVELASFAYQTLLSAHVFGDANGRSCRMFADTILQTFHLPPHTPVSMSELTSLPIATLGSARLDYKDGAKCFMHSIQKSNDIIGHEPKKQFEGREKQICIITEETSIYLRVLRDRAQSIRGLFNDSPQYMAFLMSLQDTQNTVDAILKSRKNNPNHDEDQAQRAFEHAVREMKKCAKAYNNYKLADHELNPAPGSGKKKMNWNDREKVQLMNDILSNRNRQFRRVRTNAAEKKDVKKKEEINILT